MSAADRVRRVAPGRVVALGLDAGSTTCKVVGVDAAGALVVWGLEPMDPRVAEQAEGLLAAARSVGKVDAGASGAGVPGAGVSGASVPVVATGYGRKLVAGATRAVTEISCHARGVYADLGTGGTLVDIGGQDSKVIRIGAGGALVDFAMNDKCAAGSGRFLEHTAQRLGVELADLGGRALVAEHAEPVSSTCTVFAESEVISLVARGRPLNDILLGLHAGLVDRIAAMVRGVGLVQPLLLSGGVARNAAVVELLGRVLGAPVGLPRYPQLMGAYGAALLAADPVRRHPVPQEPGSGAGRLHLVQDRGRRRRHQLHAARPPAVRGAPKGRNAAGRRYQSRRSVVTNRHHGCVLWPQVGSRGDRGVLLCTSRWWISLTVVVITATVGDNRTLER